MSHEVFLVVFLFCFGAAFMLGAHISQEIGGQIIGAFGALLWFGLATSIAPMVFGYGHVTSWTESFDTRLDNGTTYQTTAWTKSGTGYVLLVKKFGTSGFYAIRVKIVSPPLFTLVGGKPIAIVAHDEPIAPLAK